MSEDQNVIQTQTRRAITDRQLVLAILFLLIVGLFSSMGVMELRGEEGRRALVALEMVRNGDWLTPHLLGWPYLNKPPLFTWILAGLFRLFGHAGTVLVRLPSLLAWVALGWLHFRAMTREIGRTEALLSTLFLFTTGHVLFFATVLSGELDLLYGLVVWLQVMALYRGFRSGNPWHMFLISYLWMGIGLLLKGIPSLAFQGCSLVAISWIHRNWRPLFSWPHLAGILIGFGIPAAFFLAYNSQGDAILYILNLVAEGSRKSAAEATTLDVLTHLFTFPVQIVLDLLPWSLLLGLTWKKEVRQQITANPFLKFALTFIVANVWIYWLSPETRMRYLYMFLPFAMALLARMAMLSGRLQLRALLIVCLVLAGARVSYNLLVLPRQALAIEAKQGIRSKVDEILALAEGEAVYWTGAPDSLILHRTFGLADKPPPVRLDAPTWMPYALPFHLARWGHPMMTYDPEPGPGRLYLVNREELDDRPVDVLATFPGWEGPVWLCRFPTSAGRLPEPRK